MWAAVELRSTEGKPPAIRAIRRDGSAFRVVPQTHGRDDSIEVIGPDLRRTRGTVAETLQGEFTQSGFRARNSRSFSRPIPTRDCRSASFHEGPSTMLFSAT